MIPFTNDKLIIVLSVLLEGFLSLEEKYDMDVMKRWVLVICTTVMSPVGMVLYHHAITSQNVVDGVIMLQNHSAASVAKCSI